MTEAEWLTSTDPAPMLGHLVLGASRRKLRLFVCARAFDLWQLLADERSRLAVLHGEAFADGEIDTGELFESHAAANAVREQIDPLSGGRHSRGRKSQYGDWASRRAADVAALAAAPELPSNDLFRLLEWERGAVWWTLAERLRDLFGNPFRPVNFDPHWRTADPLGLARAAYEDGAFERLPLLADALMDAGCNDDQILGHCRSDGPHVRGCWVVDLVLGKE
jgi:hypothetical protein